MRRGRTVVRRRDLEGDERSLELCGAIAAQVSPELAEALLHGIAQLNSIGGQLFIASVRNKYQKITVRDQAGNIAGEQWVKLQDHKDPGDYETDAYVFHWDHIATAVRNSKKEPDTAFPAEPRQEVQVEELWDQQQEEVGELLDDAVSPEDAFADEGADPAEADREKELA